MHLSAIQKQSTSALNVTDLNQQEYNMGSGSKFEINLTPGFGLAVYVSRFPHQLSVNILVGCWTIYLGFGKGYDE